MSEIDVNELGMESEKEVVPFVAPAGLPVAGMRGEFSAADIRYSWISLVQSVGPSFAAFPRNAGDFLYGGKTIVPRPMEVAFYSVMKKYRQNLKYDPTGSRPLEFETAQEVVAAGGNLKRGVPPGFDENNYVPNAVAYLGIFAPRTGGKKEKRWADDIDFVLKNGSEDIVPCLWYLKGTRYGIVIPTLLTATALFHHENQGEAGKDPLPYLRFILDAKHDKSGSNFIYKPTLIRKPGVNSEATVKLLTEGFGS